MQHTKADSVLEERGPRVTVHRENNPARRFADDFSLPGKMYFSVPVFGIVKDAKRVAAVHHIDVRQFCRYGFPILVARGDIDAPNNFAAPNPQVAQVTFGIKQRHWPSLQRDGLWQRLLAPVIDDVFGQNLHDSATFAGNLRGTRTAAAACDNSMIRSFSLTPIRACPSATQVYNFISSSSACGSSDTNTIRTTCAPRVRYRTFALS